MPLGLFGNDHEVSCVGLGLAVVRHHRSCRRPLVRRAWSAVPAPVMTNLHSPRGMGGNFQSELRLGTLLRNEETQRYSELELTGSLTHL